MKTLSGQLQRVGNGLLLRQESGKIEYLDWLLDNYNGRQVIVVVEDGVVFDSRDSFEQEAVEYVVTNYSPDEVYR